MVKIPALKNVKKAKEEIRIQAGVTMKKELWRKTKELALKLDINASQYIEELIMEDMKKRNFYS